MIMNSRRRKLEISTNLVNFWCICQTPNSFLEEDEKINIIYDFF